MPTSIMKHSNLHNPQITMILSQHHSIEADSESVSNSTNIPVSSNLTIRLVYPVPVLISDESIPNIDRGVALEAWKPVLADLTRARESTKIEAKNLDIKPCNSFKLPFLAEVASKLASFDDDETDLPCSDSSSVAATQRGSSTSLEIEQNNPDDTNEGALITSKTLSRQKALLKPLPLPIRRTWTRSDTKPQEEEDYISDFRKRFPKMPSVETIEKEIDMNNRSSNLPVTQAPKAFGFNPCNPFFKHLSKSVKEKYHSEAPKEVLNEKKGMEQTAFGNVLYPSPRQGLLAKIRARGAAKETEENLESHRLLCQGLFAEIRARGTVKETAETFNRFLHKPSLETNPRSAWSNYHVAADSGVSIDVKELENDSSKSNPFVPTLPPAQEAVEKVDSGTVYPDCFAHPLETMAKDKFEANSDSEGKKKAPLGNPLGTAAQQKLFKKVKDAQYWKLLRTKYQFEADSEDDEDEISPDTSLENAALRLQELAKAVEVKSFAHACFHRDMIVQKNEGVDGQITMNRARLDRIH
jgi:hypothetical protein